MSELKRGTRVRLRTRPHEGSIMEVRRFTAVAIMDDRTLCESDLLPGDGYGWHEWGIEALLGEWLVLPDQTPNPDHASALGGWLKPLELPDWAVNGDILDLIEAQVLGVHADLGDGEDIKAVLDQIDAIRPRLGIELEPRSSRPYYG